MAKIGYRSYVGYGDEATYNTAIAPTGFVEYNSEGFKKDIEEKLVDAINGTQHYKKRVTLNQSVNGSVSFPMVPGSILRMLKNGMGNAITVTSLATGVYQYVFLAGINSFTSMTFEVCRDTTDTATTMRYTGCGINSIKFSCGVNNVLQADVDLMGASEVLANTISTAAYRTLNPYTFVGGSVKIGDSSATATSPVVDSFDVTVANNLAETRGIGNASRQALTPGMQDVTFNVSAQFDNTTLYNRFLNGTQSYVYAKFDNGQTIGATIYTNSIMFEAYKCYFNGSTPNIGGPSEILKASYPIRSIFNDGSTTTLKVTVITDVATITAS